MADQKHGDGGEQQAPIIVIKKGGHGGHHGGAWKVAYADLVTSMMSLFIVLWLTSQKQDVKEAVAGYFRDPGAFNKAAHGGVLDGASILPEQGGGAGPNGTQPTPEQIRQEQEKILEKTAEKVRESLAGMPDFKQLEGQIEIKMTDVGLNIQLVEKSNSLFFDVGSQNLSASAREVMSVLAARLGELPNKLAIEGHTDSRPYPAGAAYTNWELSADRANSARRYMLEHGLRAGQVAEVRGFADTRPRNPDNASDVQNRRISITVLYDDAAQRAAAAAAASGAAATFAIPEAGAAGADAGTPESGSRAGVGGGGGHEPAVSSH
jgi:chemotaxis protein MotB